MVGFTDCGMLVIWLMMNLVELMSTMLIVYSCHVNYAMLGLVLGRRMMNVAAAVMLHAVVHVLCYNDDDTMLTVLAKFMLLCTVVCFDYTSHYPLLC
jgi:hypothetical protein